MYILLNQTILWFISRYSNPTCLGHCKFLCEILLWHWVKIRFGETRLSRETYWHLRWYWFVAKWTLYLIFRWKIWFIFYVETSILVQRTELLKKYQKYIKGLFLFLNHINHFLENYIWTIFHRAPYQTDTTWITYKKR